MPEPTVSPQAKRAAKEVLRNLNDRRGMGKRWTNATLASSKS